jgi:hypothetical protein
MNFQRFLIAAASLAWLAAPLSSAHAFCGFYVAKVDTQLFNEASKVVIARHDGKTVITMVNDYKGEPQEFATVIPVPDVLERGQIHVTDPAIVEHLDAYTAPRLVEYFDPDPCTPYDIRMEVEGLASRALKNAAAPVAAGDALGVTIEAQYTVGEYDILILSAEQSGGLKTWLTANGYTLPEGVAPVLDDYLAKGMKFFVAKVNLAEKSKLASTFLRPLQIAFESEHFMLPIRLGMANAAGPQELYVFTLTRKGRVETRNYRTVRLPSDVTVPLFVKDEFGNFFEALFDRQVDREDRRAVFLEYAWDMAWCDPCAADPLSVAELRELGVFWLAEGGGEAGGAKAQARDVFATRLHLRYDAEHFPDDLVFRETRDRSNFQGRYVLQHPWSGAVDCQAAKAYYRALPDRFEREAQQLTSLTNWPIAEVRDKMERSGQSFAPRPVPIDDEMPWWKKLWDKADFTPVTERRSGRG